MYFLMAWKQMKKRILLLMLILTMALAFCQAVVFYAEAKLENDAIRVPIAVLNEDTNPETESLLRLVLSNNEIKALFDVEQVKSADEAIELLDDNEILAYIVFPEGFMESVMYGSNLSPTVHVEQTGFLEQKVLAVLVDTLEGVMQQTQSGIYTAMDIIRLEKGQDSDLVMDANWAYIKVLLDRNDMYVTEDLDYVSDLSLEEHYVCTLGIFFLFLTTVLFHKELNLQSDINFVKHIKAVDKKYFLFYVSKLLLVFLLYLLLFVGMLLVLGAEMGLALLLSLCNGVLFFVLFQCVWFTKINQQIAIMQLNFVFYGVCLFMAGGVIPTLWIPEIITKIAWFTPLVQIREILSVGVVSGKSIMSSQLLLVACNVILCGCLWRYMHKIGQKS